LENLEPNVTYNQEGLSVMQVLDVDDFLILYFAAKSTQQLYCISKWWHVAHINRFHFMSKLISANFNAKNQFPLMMNVFNC
jgi:hypothetical protein